MKRQRQEEACSTKEECKIPLLQDPPTPLHSLDFLNDILPYLPQWTLYHLSRVSKSLNTLVWRLFSTSQRGLTFFESLSTEESISEYLSKTPNLQTLNFSGFREYNMMPLLTNLTSLTSLSYQVGHSRPFSPFPFPAISHLTRLTHLECTFYADTQVAFFTNLTQLSLFSVGQTAFEYLNQLTALRSLTFEVPFVRAPVPICLTNLSSLKIQGKNNPFPFLHLMTNLTTLSTRSCAQIPLKDLTNLQTLEYMVVDLDDLKFQSNLTSLKLQFRNTKGQVLLCLDQFTNLQTLEIDTEWNIYEACAYVPALTSLTRLHLGRKSMMDTFTKMSAFSTLTNLTSLSVSPGKPPDRDFSGLGGLTNLQDLCIPMTDLTFVTGLRNLRSLSLEPQACFETELFCQPLQGLSNLQTLGFGRSCCPTDMKNLTNLTTLAISGDLSLEGMGFLTRLKNLTLEGLVQPEPIILAFNQGMTQLRTLEVVARKGTVFLKDALHPLSSIPDLEFKHKHHLFFD